MVHMKTSDELRRMFLHRNPQTEIQAATLHKVGELMADATVALNAMLPDCDSKQRMIESLVIARLHALQAVMEGV